MKRLVAACFVVPFFLAACSSGDSGGGPKRETAPTADWLVAGSAASCVESFSVENLAGRSWAFDGTITNVVPPKDPESEKPEDVVTEVTFAVDRWYKGGTGTTVTVLTYNSPGSVTSIGDIDPSIGARILASGEDVYLWGCGFSMVYTEENAQVFGQAFGE